MMRQRSARRSAAHDALRAGKDSGAARSASASSSTQPLNRNANPDRESDSRFAGRVWHCAAAASESREKELPQLTEESETRLSGFAKRLFTTLYEELRALDQRILVIEAEINQAFQQNALCQRIAEVEGVGPVTATAVVAAISNGTTSMTGGSLPPGSGWFRGNTPAARSSDCQALPREAIVICERYWCTARDRWYSVPPRKKMRAVNGLLKSRRSLGRRRPVCRGE